MGTTIKNFIISVLFIETIFKKYMHHFIMATEHPKSQQRHNDFCI